MNRAETQMGRGVETIKADGCIDRLLAAVMSQIDQFITRYMLFQRR